MAKDEIVSVTGRLYPVRPFAGASIAVFRGSRVLLARRAKGAGAGLLSLPGGVIELGESAEAAALRELREEVAVEANIMGLAGHINVIEYDQSRVRHHYIVLTFAGRWISGEGETSDEASEVLWTDISELGGLNLSKGLPPILRKAYALASAAQ